MELTRALFESTQMSQKPHWKSHLSSTCLEVYTALWFTCWSVFFPVEVTTSDEHHSDAIFTHNRESARWAGAVMMYVISKLVLKKKHGIEDERAALYEALNDFAAAVGPKRDFLGGKSYTPVVPLAIQPPPAACPWCFVVYVPVWLWLWLWRAVFVASKCSAVVAVVGSLRLRECLWSLPRATVPPPQFLVCRR